MKLKASHVARYFQFCAERHAIYACRQRGDEWPWTTNEILKTYKFTNVYRELDIGTVWLRENIRGPYADDPELFFNIALYRRYNYWPMAECIGYVDVYEEVLQLPDIARSYKTHGGQVFTGAHMINCPKPFKSKIDYVFDIGAKELWEKRRGIEDCHSLQEAFNWLKTLGGFGPFISYEVVTDLRWTRYLQDAPDINTWANPGPGAQRGILRLMDYPINNHAGLPKLPPGVKCPGSFIAAMQALLEKSRSVLPDWMPAFELRDVEHSLCEFDKYERVRTGEGRPRSKFVPPHLRDQV